MLNCKVNPIYKIETKGKKANIDRMNAQKKPPFARQISHKWPFRQYP